jgi:predicted ATPase/DNA-binding CsgD family transcriptional regulator
VNREPEPTPVPQVVGPRGPQPSPTPFFGRAREIEDVGGLLGNHNCRLLTLLGPGGIGKTRLALEAAGRFAHYFADGVVVVNLQAVSSDATLVAAIADALALPLTGQLSLYEQLLAGLRGRDLLLLLDNFEQLLDMPGTARGSAGASGLLSTLLAEAPALRLLVTSREVLNLQEEWLYPLDGLDLPGDDAHAAESGAVQLFVERARRVRREFQLEGERATVVQICRLVEGMPLAIELAAAWAKTLPCATIAAEIQRGLQLLTSNVRNMPERHRSVRATFDQSWAQLDEHERRVFAQLAVFRGGFSREAAERVLASIPAAGQAPFSTLPTLAALVDKSLLRHEPDGRFHVHELLRQYAQQQLEQFGLDADSRQTHAAYFASFLADRRDALLGGDQVAALTEIAAELPNIRAAWSELLARGAVAELERASHSLFVYYHLRGPYPEGIAALEAAAQALRELGEPGERALAPLLVDLAWLHIRLGQLAESGAAVAEGRALAERHGLQPPPGMATDPLIVQTVLALIAGDYTLATELGMQALERAHEQGHANNLPHAYFVLADASLARGQAAAALHYAEHAYTAVLAARDRWYLAYVHNTLGQLAVDAGNYDEARRHFGASFAIREAFSDPEGMAVAQIYLGEVALAQHAHAEAYERFARAQAIYERIGDRGGLARALDGLGCVAATAGAAAEAARHFAEALALAAAIPFVRAMLASTLNAAALLLQLGQTARAIPPLLVVRDHPSSLRQQRERAVALLAPFEAERPTHLPELAVLTARLCRDLEALAHEPLAAIPQVAPAAAPAQHSSPQQPLAEPLAEPLTEREREVLGLIAQGHSNQQIADQLVLSVGTVKWYAAQIYGKLGIQTRTQAVARARALGLIP